MFCLCLHSVFTARFYSVLPILDVGLLWILVATSTRQFNRITQIQFCLNSRLINHHLDADISSSKGLKSTALIVRCSGRFIYLFNSNCKIKSWNLSSESIGISSENMLSDEEKAAAASAESTRQHFSKLLQLSETGAFYDCTIRASSAVSTTYRDFQCHKLILSLSSDMFMTMFSSNFKEANMSRDEPMVLQNVEPEVFACVMRYMYGRQKDIKDTSFGVEVYKLAHELQIDSLIQELDTFFMGSKKASEVFAIFDLYLGLDISQETLSSCKLLLERETAVALASEQWLNVSVVAVQEFLQMDLLLVEEVELVRALIRWGKHQVQKDGDDPTNGQKLRSKIFRSLKFIRFVGLTQDEFANLCLEELGAVLNLEEKHTILMALVTKKWNLLPGEINTLEAAMPRKKPYAVCQLAFDESSHFVYHGSFKPRICFVLDKNAAFAGLKINSEANPAAYEAFSFQLFDNDTKVIIGQGSSTDKISAEGEEYVKVNSRCSLTAGIEYTLIFTFSDSTSAAPLNFASYTVLPNQPAATSSGLTFSITAPNVYVYLEKMLFLLT